MLDIESTAIDVESAENGKWFDYKGAKFLIARHNNDLADRLRAQLTLKHWDELTASTTDPEKLEELSFAIETEVLSASILKDWSGVGTNGKAIKYTPKQGMKYLGDRKFKDIRRFVELSAMNTANWHARVEEEVVESVKDTAAS